VIQIKILIITGTQSYSIIEKSIETINHEIKIIKAPISVSAFLSEEMTSQILRTSDLSGYDIILLPGFIQWDTTKLEKIFSIKIRKGPEFASDLPVILKDLEKIELSNIVSANKMYETSMLDFYNQIFEEQLNVAKNNCGLTTFYINQERSDVMIGKNMPPPIIAEIVNCTEKNDSKILTKVKHYIHSGADIIDLGCVSNKPNPNRLQEIIKIIRDHFEILLSIDSMDDDEITMAVENGIDMILSLDLGNYSNFLTLPKDIPIVILPTNIKQGYFPRDPKARVKNLFELTRILQKKGFQKLIADPLLETPISPGICNSLETYFLYKKKIQKNKYQNLELPLFFGISNVVELMDIDSVGVNGLLASIAIELDIGVLFTVEHSTKLMGGVSELKESVKLNYISKYKKTPPISQGIQVFKAKGKTSQDRPKIDESEAIIVDKSNSSYVPDKKGYFKLYVNPYSMKIYALFFSNEHKLLNTIIGMNAEALSKKIIEMELTDDISHLNYLGRELNKAEFCLFSGKPYIQEE